MRFEATDDFNEVSLAEGLTALQAGGIFKLHSDGLETDEYIYWDDKKGFCYEDGCVIGKTFDEALCVLLSLKWCLSHKFYA